jgi:hypothetical protein
MFFILYGALAHFQALATLCWCFLWGEDVISTLTSNLWGYGITVSLTHLFQNLSGIGGPTSSYAAVYITFEFTSTCQLLSPGQICLDEVEIPLRKDFIITLKLFF